MEYSIRFEYLYVNAGNDIKCEQNLLDATLLDKLSLTRSHSIVRYLYIVVQNNRHPKHAHIAQAMNAPLRTGVSCLRHKFIRGAAGLVNHKVT